MKLDFTQPKTQILTVLLIVGAVIGYLAVQVNALEGTSIRPNIDAAPSGGDAPTETTLELTDDAHIRGNKDADIIIYEFSDFECPFCQRHHPTLQQIVDTYDGQVAWVYKHFPLSSHLNAQEKAEASECVAELGGNDAFWTFADEVFERGTSLPVADLPELASNAGVDKEAFNECLDSERHAETVNAQLQEGLSAGVTGTPGNVIVNVETGEQQLIPGALPFNQFESVIEGML